MTCKITQLQQQISQATDDEHEHTLCLQLLTESKRIGDKDSEDLATDLLHKWDHEEN